MADDTYPKNRIVESEMTLGKIGRQLTKEIHHEKERQDAKERWKENANEER